MKRLVFQAIDAAARPRRAVPLFALVAIVTAGGVYALAGRNAAESMRHTAAPEVASQPSRSPSTPSAAEFGVELVRLGNAYGASHHLSIRLAHTDCVQASPGHYMCSYFVVRPNRSHECHIVQARWTPRAESIITVTLGSRVRRCGTLKEALHSL
ncbi:MAG TPA: hypothetical protein VH760_07080 [Gaiellaceae bacterium]|jgi:hypothetical protein